MRGLMNRFWLVLPWIFNLWIFAQAVNGEINGLLAFFLLMIFIPLAAFINVITAVYIKGRELFSAMQQPAEASKVPKAKPVKRKKAVNYADLPWWSPKKWMDQ